MEIFMNIHGLQNLTLLDYPGYTAATVFLGSCNFRCPFCQNSSLVLAPDLEPVISEDEVFQFLKKRKRVLDGVCITGGEPTLSKDLEPFLQKIKHLGYLVKLDTNGSRPNVLKELVSQGLLDYVAMDIKSSREGYAAAAGIEGMNLDAVEESVRFLLEEAPVDYEFRTTAVKGLHQKQDFVGIRDWIAGCRRYYLQNYRDSEQILVPGVYASFSKGELEEFLAVVRETIPGAELRGVS